MDSTGVGVYGRRGKRHVKLWGGHSVDVNYPVSWEQYLTIIFIFLKSMIDYAYQYDA